MWFTKFIIACLMVVFGITNSEIYFTSQYYSSIYEENSSKSVSPQSVQLNKVKTYGSTDEIIIGKIASFTVDNQNRVYIADRDKTTIHVFNADGSFLKSIGRRGKGPGEFSAISPSTTMKVYKSKLYVTDVTEGFEYFPHRLQVYDLENLEFLHTIRLLPRNRDKYEKLNKFSPKEFFPLGEGKFLIGYHRAMWEYRNEESFIHYVIQNSSGEITSSPIIKQKDLRYLVYKHPSGNSSMHSFPFFNRSLLAISNNNEIYTARTGSINIEVYDTNGEHIRTIKHAFDNKELNLNMLLDRYEENNYMSELDYHEGQNVALKMIRQADSIPHSWPAMETMLIDDKNRIWLSTIIDKEDVYEWWVLKESGEVLAKFEWPKDKPIKAIKNGHLFTKEYDESGLSYVIKYDINFR